MVYQIVFKKRFQNKLEKLLNYIEYEFGLLVAQKFMKLVDRKCLTVQQQPFIGQPPANIASVRSIRIGRYNRLYYRIESKKIIVLNIYDTRINPKRNRLR